MTVSRSFWWMVLLLTVTGGVNAAQSPKTDVGSVAFDVASVKRYQPTAGRQQTDSISVMPGGRFTAPSATLRGLITAAYGILDIQIVDSRGLIANDRFEIEATTKADVTV